MDTSVLLAIVITFLYAVFRFLEIRYWDKEYPPLKHVVREIIKVFLSSLIGASVFGRFNGQISDFMNIIMDKKVLDPSSIQVFTDEPSF
jgi:hypothetical protein